MTSHEDITLVVLLWLRRVTVVRFMLISCLLAVLAACDQGKERGGPWMPPGTTPPSSASVEIRRAADGYEIEVQHPEGFHAGSLSWMLSIGTARFLPSHASSAVGGYYGMVFTLSSAEFDALREGSPIFVHYGPDVRQGWTFGNFNRRDVRP